jgi:hypothetical protein
VKLLDSRRFELLIAVLGIALLSFEPSMRVSSEAIYAGIPFVYEFYMGSSVIYVLLIIIIPFGIFLLLLVSVFRHHFHVFEVVLTLICVVCLWRFWSGPPADWVVHLQSINYQNYNYNVYTVIGGIENDYLTHTVLVECDQWGIVCKYVQKRSHGALLWLQPTVTFRSSEAGMNVLFNDEVVYTIPLK